MWEALVQFYNHPFFVICGGVSVTMSVLWVIVAAIGWICGVTPLIFRLGMALSKRNIAIFGTSEKFESLKSTLVDSNLFKERSIIHIKRDNIEKAKQETLFLVDWETAGDNIERIFSARKSSQTAILIYAKPKSIPQDKMDAIVDMPNTVIVNARGRLLNDVLTSLITTSHK
jgi:hypothetical protein